MRIDTEIMAVTVEIGDKEYLVAEKTIETAERLKKAEDDGLKRGRLEYEIWLDQLRILLGNEAVTELFPDGKRENMDRMGMIYRGVFEAFDYNGREAKDAAAQRSISQAEEMARALQPFIKVVEMLKSIPTAAPGDAKPLPAILSQFPGKHRPG